MILNCSLLVITIVLLAFLVERRTDVFVTFGIILTISLQAPSVVSETDA